MKRVIFLLAATFLPATAMAEQKNHRAERVAQNLAQNLRELAMEARSEAEQSVNGPRGPMRSQKFRAIAMSARRSAMSVRREVLPAIQSDRRHQIVRAMQNFRQNWQALNQAFSAVHRMPYDIKGLHSDASQKFERLRMLLRQGGGGQGRWQGSCRVVLETIWGSDLRDFNGSAVGFSRQAATQAARQDGLNQCNAARRGPLQKCTVASACDARQFGRG